MAIRNSPRVRLSFRCITTMYTENTRHVNIHHLSHLLSSKRLKYPPISPTIRGNMCTTSEWSAPNYFFIVCRWSKFAVAKQSGETFCFTQRCITRIGIYHTSALRALIGYATFFETTTTTLTKVKRD